MPELAVPKDTPDRLIPVVLGSSPWHCWPWAHTLQFLLEDVTKGWWMVNVFQARREMIRRAGFEEGLVNEDKVYETEKEGAMEKSRKHGCESWKLFLCSWVINGGLSQFRYNFLRWMNIHFLGGIKQQAWHEVESLLKGSKWHENSCGFCFLDNIFCVFHSG